MSKRKRLGDVCADRAEMPKVGDYFLIDDHLLRLVRRGDAVFLVCESQPHLTMGDAEVYSQLIALGCISLNPDQCRKVFGAKWEDAKFVPTSEAHEMLRRGTTELPEPEPTKPEPEPRPKFKVGDRVVACSFGSNFGGTVTTPWGSGTSICVNLDHGESVVFRPEVVRHETVGDIRERGKRVRAKLRPGMRVKVSTNPVGYYTGCVPSSDSEHRGKSGRFITFAKGEDNALCTFDEIAPGSEVVDVWIHNLIPLDGEE